MKIAVVSEYTADEAALKILVDSVLGIKSDLVSPRKWRPGGWSHVLALLPTIVKDLHYSSDADGLVIVIDSDESPPHAKPHEILEDPSCRLCQLRSVVTKELSALRTVPARSTLKVALGLAVPQIEAWYLCGIDPHVTEAEWARRLKGERLTYNKQSLKRAVYSSDRMPISAKTELATKAAQRLTANLEELEQRFPNGFGPLLRDLRNW
ncbi:MAG TPA: hypothetical protein VN643_09510 [Pyrinomonadaceae bacterium]|nr:hypothetical protein [Pyrinomonadaceae bacterium]